MGSMDFSPQQLLCGDQHLSHQKKHRELFILSTLLSTALLMSFQAKIRFSVYVNRLLTTVTKLYYSRNGRAAMNKPALKILQHNHIHVIIIEILFFPHF